MEHGVTRVTCVAKRYGHHTESGGYDRLAAAVGADVIVGKQIPGLLGKVSNKAWWYLTPRKNHFSDYQVGDWLAEVQALTVGFIKPPDVLHVLYSSSLDLLIKWRNLLRCPLVVTFHAPFANIGSDLQQDGMRGHRFDNYRNGLDVDVAVVVARSQIAPLQRWIEPNRIVYIPHGIDTDLFRPDGPILDRDRMRVLIVGEHMRDWLVIHRTIDELNHRGLDIEFDVVTNERCFAYFNGCANVQYHSRIAEAKLIGLYRSADVLFIPMTNATANNSILEALACGTPVISTRVGGIPDYVNDESGWLLPIGDVAGHVNLIASLQANRELSSSRRQAARTQALKFDWRLVAEQMVAVYAAAAKSQRQAVRDRRGN
jgi:glycosyltransferase involved in cell wall biosynthesis